MSEQPVTRHDPDPWRVGVHNGVDISKNTYIGPFPSQRLAWDEKEKLERFIAESGDVLMVWIEPVPPEPQTPPPPPREPAHEVTTIWPDGKPSKGSGHPPRHARRRTRHVEARGPRHSSRPRRVSPTDPGEATKLSCVGESED